MATNDNCGMTINAKNTANSCEVSTLKLLSLVCKRKNVFFFFQKLNSVTLNKKNVRKCEKK